MDKCKTDFTGELAPLAGEVFGALTAKGVTCHELGGGKDAIETEPLFEHILQNHGKYIEILEGVLKAKSNEGLFAKASLNTPGGIPIHTGEVKLSNRDMVTFYNDRGNTLRSSGAQDKAIDSYTRAILLDPQYAVAYHNRCAVWYDKSNWNRVITDCSRAIELKPNSTNTYGMRAVALYNTGNLDRAIEDFTKIISANPLVPSNYLNRGIAWFEKKEWDKAIADFTSAIDLDPNNSLIRNARGAAFANKGDQDKAIADFSAAIHLDPKKALYYCNRGLSKFEKSDIVGAIADYSQAIALEPRNVGFYTKRASFWARSGNLDKAIEDYTQAIAIEPKNTDLYMARSVKWREKGDLDKALADYNQLIILNPKRGETYVSRARILAGKQEWDKAISDYTQAIALGSKNYFERALCWYEKGKWSAAVGDMVVASRTNEEDAAYPYTKLVGRWQRGEYRIIAERFIAETGKDIPLFHTVLIQSYALWSSDSKKSYDTFQIIIQNFLNTKLSKSTKFVILDSLKAMPEDMQKDVAVTKALALLHKKIGK